MRIIAQRQAFGQGNKRTSWLYTVTLLGQFGFEMPGDVTFGVVKHLMMAVAVGRLDDPEVIAGCLVDFFMGRYDTT